MFGFIKKEKNYGFRFGFPKSSLWIVFYTTLPLLYGNINFNLINGQEINLLWWFRVSLLLIVISLCEDHERGAQGPPFNSLWLVINAGYTLGGADGGARWSDQWRLMPESFAFKRFREMVVRLSFALRIWG